MDKITIAEAKDGGATALIFYCFAMQRGICCGRSGWVPIRQAVRRWGADTPISRVPAVCERCGVRSEEIRPYYPRYKDKPWPVR